MNKFFRWEPFVGYTNDEIDSLKKELLNAQKNVQDTEKKIKDIQSVCEHEYMFVSHGMYEDSYTCRKCGKEF